ncbi:MAG TPA: response regulator [Candidatus Limnocylindria bacterium]|jgi:CheY-like chemotaxis protein|nr:response regulator [Candidatus Limnocylindria bacterium]
MANDPVLVVDDDPAIRNAVRDLLEEQGIPVETATDGQDAMAKVTQRRPRLVLLDMRMPVMDGWGFAAALREAGIAAPVVVMTAAADARRWAEEIGAIGVVPKPFGIDELIGAVQRYSS